MERSHELGCGRRRIDSGGGSATKRFELPGAKATYLPDRPFVVSHYALDARLDFDAHRIEGTARLAISTRRPLRTLKLDAVGLEVTKVTHRGSREPLEAAFSTTDRELTIEAPAPVSAGESFDLEIAYATRPQRGLYFVGPDSQFPNKPRQAWTQGQDEDARAWFPCLDRPGDRATFELRATVPAPLEVFSNGVLAESHEGAKTRTFHWKMERAIPPYLATLVAGEFSKLEDRWEDIPLRFLVPKGREEEAKLSFSPTKDMLAFFSEWTGVRYPWPRYDQVCVEDFIFGGMENTTQTTLTLRTLHDARAHEDFQSDMLVAHELAHQWFGDLVTCKDWAHGWLNEGFATYAEALWKERSEGDDAYLHYSFGTVEEYLEEFDTRYSRPIVQRTYHAPIDIFDRHLYEKGGSVLHYLRFLLGEDDLRASIKHYLEKHREKPVETVDFQRAIQETTGRDLERFFDEHVLGRGHASLKLAFEHDEERKLAKLTIEQTQDPSSARDVFHLELGLSLWISGKREAHRLQLEERKQTFHFPAEKRPDWVALDPGGWALVSLDISELPESMHVLALEKDEDPITRIRAARALGKKATPKAIEALRRAVSEDRFWGVSFEAATALGTIKTESARRSLEDGLGRATHAKVRRAIVKALGEFLRDEAAASAVLSVLEGDRTWLVEAEAAKSLGRIRSERSLALLEKTLERRESWNDVIRQGAIDGLAALRDPRALPVVSRWTAYGKDTATRAAAARALGSLADTGGETTRKDALDRLSELTRDKELRVKIAAVAGLETTGDSRALSPLDVASSRDSDGRVRRLARESAARLREGTEGGARVLKLREDLDQSREDARKVKDRLERLEAIIETKLPKDGPVSGLPGREPRV
ncbi:HEAT repeat domain-containing protein [bacterium]|nr:HEAT repeat domain-containing protein [bacterium]